MLTFDTLPVVLVSAATKPVAASIISDLIDIDVTADYDKDIESPDRVWRLLNKYYSADVRVHALTDGEILTVNPHYVEAHIIHITEEEAEGGAGEAGGAARAAARAGACGGAWARAGVRVLLAECAAHGALGAWARAQRAEWAPRREAPPAGEGRAGPFAETFGVERARAALHAHRWPAAPRPESECDAESGSSSGAEGADESDDESRAVERAEAFAAALAALGAGAAASRGGPERLARAEHLALAFCRALGLDADGA